MRLEGFKIALFVEKQYEDLELWYPYYRLKEEGAKVVLVGPKEAETFESKHGYPAKSEASAEKLNHYEFDGLIIPGGYAPDHMRRSGAMIRFAREMSDEGKVVAAICHAGWMLASAGILNGRRCTSYSSIKDDMINAGGDWIDDDVVRDGNLITSRHPEDLPAFCREIIQALEEVGPSSEKSKVTRKQLEKAVAQAH